MPKTGRSNVYQEYYKPVSTPRGNIRTIEGQTRTQNGPCISVQSGTGKTLCPVPGTHYTSTHYTQLAKMPFDGILIFDLTAAS